MAKYPETVLYSYGNVIATNFYTRITPFQSGAEHRNRKWRFPKRTVQMVYQAKTKAERDTIYDWFRDYYGSYGDSSGALFYWFDQNTALRHYKDEKIGYGNGATLTFDIPSKNTTQGATLQIYEAGVLQTLTTDYTISIGTGSDGADQVIWNGGNAPANGALLTCNFNGQLRLRCRFQEDSFSEEIPTKGRVYYYNFNVTLYEASVVS